jgi:hypothetical protein
VSSVSTYLMFAVLVSMQPPQADESALPSYDEAPAPVADPAAPAPLTPEKARRWRRVGTGLLIASGFFLAAGVAGLAVGISGLAAKPEFGPDFFEQERRARLRGNIGVSIGGPCTATGVAFAIVGGSLRSQARSAPKVQVSIVPTWLYGGGGIAVGGRF